MGSSYENTYLSFHLDEKKSFSHYRFGDKLIGRPSSIEFILFNMEKRLYFGYGFFTIYTCWRL
jgi:hypothetical protein